MRAEEYITVRINKDLADRAKAAADLMGRGISRNFVIEEAARAVLDMIDNPKARVLPKIVRLVDEAKAADSAPAELPPKAIARIQKMSAQEMADETTRDIGREILAKRKKRKAKK